MGATLRVKWELLMNWNLCNDHRSVFEDTKKMFSDSVNHLVSIRRLMFITEIKCELHFYRENQCTIG